MKSNRGALKFFLLSLITLGIYEIVFFSGVGEDLNIVAQNQKKTTHFCLVFFILSWLTLGIYPIVWFHGISAKAGTALKERGISYEFGASTFWIWMVLLSFTVVGPILYISKLCKAMNLLVDDYNNKNN